MIDDPKHTNTSVALTDEGVAGATAVLQRVRDRLWPDAPSHRTPTYVLHTRRTPPTLAATARHRGISTTTKPDEGRVCGGRA
jgi:hypothetical protein